jgi:hypothetical protein
MTLFLLLIGGLCAATYKLHKLDESIGRPRTLAALEAALDAENARLDRLLAGDLRELNELYGKH